MDELISKKYTLINEITKSNIACSYKPEKINL